MPPANTVLSFPPKEQEVGSQKASDGFAPAKQQLLLIDVLIQRGSITHELLSLALKASRSRECYLSPGSKTHKLSVSTIKDF